MKLLSAMTLSTLLLSANLVANEINTDWSTSGFEQPESALVNEEAGVIYISNMNGAPMENNGKGYISLVSTKGEIIEQQWVDGLGAPKGMAIHQQYLYVADLQTLHIIDHKAGELVSSIQAEGSKMLNDIAIDKNGVVYVSDMIGGGIYRYAEEKLESWITADVVPHPNGLFYNQGKLLLATWGIGMKEDFSTEVLGSLYEITIEGKQIKQLEGAKEIGNLDGIALIDDTIYINDWINGNVFSYKDNKTELAFNAGKSAADISANGYQLLVPMMFEARVDAYPIGN